MLEARDIAVRYGQHRAVDGVSLDVRQGELVVVLGANGAGKSSLLRALCGVTPRAGGVVRLNGEDISGLQPHLVTRAGVALVPEGRGVFGELTVRENLRLGATPARARAGEAANLDRVLALFPRLAERLPQTVRTMSGGEQQMVAIGRALMSAPDFLLLDEPSLGLSPLLAGELFLALAHLRDGRLGILLVEQNARRSLAIADRGYALEQGRIAIEGAANDLAGDPRIMEAYLGAATSKPAPLATERRAT